VRKRQRAAIVTGAIDYRQVKGVMMTLGPRLKEINDACGHRRSSCSGEFVLMMV